MGSIISVSRTHTINPRIAGYALILIALCCKFFVVEVFETTSILADLLLYTSLLITVNLRKIRYIFLFIIFVACISLINSAARNIFLILFIAYLSLDFRLKTILQISLFIQIFVLLTLSIFLWLGITHSEMFDQTLIDQRERWDYGVGNPNTFALLMYGMLSTMYLLYGKSKRVLLLMAIVAVIVYNYTVSRTFILSIFLLIFFHCLIPCLSINTNKYRLLLKCMPIMCFAILFFAIHSNGEARLLLNLALSGRIDLYANFVEGQGLTQYMFGTPTINDDTIDNAYLHLLYEGGIFFIVFFFALCYKAFGKVNRREILHIFPYIVSVFAVGLTESVFTFVLICANLNVWILLFHLYCNRDISHIC